MVIKISYDENSTSIPKEIQENYPELMVEAYDSGTLKGKKEAWAIKGSWAAKEDPFAILFDDEGKVIKAFYSESGDCTFEKINHILMTHE